MTAYWIASSDLTDTNITDSTTVLADGGTYRGDERYNIDDYIYYAEEAGVYDSSKSFAEQGLRPFSHTLMDRIVTPKLTEPVVWDGDISFTLHTDIEVDSFGISMVRSTAVELVCPDGTTRQLNPYEPIAGYSGQGTTMIAEFPSQSGDFKIIVNTAHDGKARFNYAALGRKIIEYGHRGDWSRSNENFSTMEKTAWGYDYYHRFSTKRFSGGIPLISDEEVMLTNFIGDESGGTAVMLNPLDKGYDEIEVHRHKLSQMFGIATSWSVKPDDIKETEWLLSFAIVEVT